jgi:hypothetical protein
MDESGGEVLNGNVENGSQALIDILEDLEARTPVPQGPFVGSLGVQESQATS